MRDITVPLSGGFSPDAAVPPARRQQTEQFVAGVMGSLIILRAFFKVKLVFLLHLFELLYSFGLMM